MFKFITSILFGFFLSSFSDFAVAEEKENKALHKAHISVVKDHRTVRHIGGKVGRRVRYQGHLIL